MALGIPPPILGMQLSQESQLCPQVRKGGCRESGPTGGRAGAHNAIQGEARGLRRPGGLVDSPGQGLGIPWLQLLPSQDNSGKPWVLLRTLRWTGSSHRLVWPTTLLPWPLVSCLRSKWNPSSTTVVPMVEKVSTSLDRKASGTTVKPSSATAAKHSLTTVVCRRDRFTSLTTQVPVCCWAAWKASQERRMSCNHLSTTACSGWRRAAR